MGVVVDLQPAVSTPSTTRIPTLEDPMPPQRTAPSARSKKKQTGEATVPSASWNDDDVNFLIDQIFARRAEAGDGLNFKKAFWQSIANSPDLSNPPKGAPKTWSACKDKWSRLRKMYEVVDGLANASGFAYSAELGANIGFEGENVWADYVKGHPGVSTFKNKGWAFYEKMKLIGPSKGKGKNRFPPRSSAVAPPGPSAGTSAQPEVNISGSTSGDTSSPGEAEGEPGMGTGAGSQAGALAGLGAILRMDTVTAGNGPVASTLNCPPPSVAPSLASQAFTADTHTGTGISSIFTPRTLSNRDFTPPTAPSSFTGSLASSIKPSSSISVRAGASVISTGKRKAADDDDVSMVSRSAVGSTHSSTSRKRRSVKNEAMDRLENCLDGRLVTINDTFRESLAMVGNVIKDIPRRPVDELGRSLQPSASLAGSTLSASPEDLRLEAEATDKLLCLELGVFDTEQMGTILESLRTDSSCVRMYLRLVANPSPDVIPIRRAWLTSLLKPKK